MKYRGIMKKVMAGILGTIMTASAIPSALAEKRGDVLLHYDFNSDLENGIVADSGENANNGQVWGNVEVENGYAYFDGQNSYIEMPQSIAAGCEDASFVINVRPDMDRANQFTFTLGNSSNDGYLFLNTNNWASSCRFAITGGNHEAEDELITEGIAREQWASIVIVMDNHSMKMYVNGELKAEGETRLLVSSLGNTGQNYLAKSQYSGDEYFKGYIDDFRIYSAALTEEEILAIYDEHKESSAVLDNHIAQREIEIVADGFKLEDYVLTESISLPESYENATITWKSEDEGIMTYKGEITRGEEDSVVTLTAIFEHENGNTAEREYTFTVVHAYSDREKAELDAKNISIQANLMFLKEDLYLPNSGQLGSSITWDTSDEEVITRDGKITRAPSGEGSRSATLTALVRYDDEVVMRDIEVSVEEEDYAYLFAYFTGNNSSQEKMFYGLSRDGYNFRTINYGNPVLESRIGHECLRDPFIMRGQNGKYYCLVTDMRSSEGWTSQSSIIIFESDDLVNWDDGTLIDFNQFGSYNRAWAPQAIWDSEFYDKETGEYGAYMIYLALKEEWGGVTQMYKVYTKDMKTLITEPEILYKRADDLNDIDSDIIFKDGTYYMYVKDESHGGIYVVTSSHAGGPYSERINALPRKDTNGKDVAIEGSGIYKLMNEEKYNLVYDAYGAGFFVMSETEDLVNFTQLERNDYSFDFTPRHGYVITISKAECDALQAVYGTRIPERMWSKTPILYYDFESEEDKSGNFFNAQLAQSASFAQGIGGGQGLCLDGTSESYALVPADAVKNLEAYTIAAWVKPDKADRTQRVFDFGESESKNLFLTPYYGNGVVRCAITMDSYWNEHGVSVEKNIAAGEWTHFAVSHDGDVMRLYIDGELAGYTEDVHLSPYEMSEVMDKCYIGKSQYSADVNFDGIIDEFRIYNRAISDDEVMELYKLNQPFSYSVSETEKEIVATISGSPGDMLPFAAIIAQYDGEIMVSAAYEKIDFSVKTDYEIKVGKNGESYKLLLFDGIATLKPLK